MHNLPPLLLGALIAGAASTSVASASVNPQLPHWQMGVFCMTALQARMDATFH